MVDELTLPLQSMAIFLLVGAAAAWGAIEVRIWRGKPVLQYEPRDLVPWTALDLLLTIAIYLASQAVCLGLAIHFFGLDPANIHNFAETPLGPLALLAGTAASGLLTFGSSVALVTFRTAATPRDLGFVFRALPRDTVYGLVAFLATAPVIYLIQLLFVVVVKIEYEHPLIKALQQRKDPTTIGLALFAAVIVAPLAEEFLFRVLLQGSLEKLESLAIQRGSHKQPEVWPQTEPHVESPVLNLRAVEPTASSETARLAGLPLGTFPILISSVLFALMHLGQGAAPVPLFFYALVLGFLYQRTHRITPSLVAHFALNSVSMAMLFLSPIPGPN